MRLLPNSKRGLSMEIKKLDHIAEEILDVFEVLGFDEEYIDDKRNTLIGKDRFAVLLWCNELDQRCLKALAGQLGISADNLAVTIKTLRML